MVVIDRLDSIIKSSVGNYRLVKEHRNNSTRTGVFEIQTENKERLFVKIHNRLNRWNPEVYAYQNWVSAIHPYAPKLLHHFKDNDLFGIIITAIEGRTINEYNVTNENVLEKSYYDAGRVLKKLHDNFKGNFFGIPTVEQSKVDTKGEVDPVNYIISSLDALEKLGKDKGLLREEDTKLIKWCIENCNVFIHSKPVPTHWDYTQNNWMINDKGNFTGIIDFENTLWGLEMDSFGVMLERYTNNKPHLTKAIFSGYGLRQTDEVEKQLMIVGVKSAVAGIIYGNDIKNDRIYSLALKRLNKLISGYPY